MQDKALGRFALVLVGIVLLFACYAAFYAGVAMGQGTRYLMLNRLYEFEYLDMLPFTPYREMQWDSVRGFSELSDTPDYLYTIIDSDLRLGYVLQDVTSGNCFVLYLREAYGEDNMPHVQEARWLESCGDETG